MFAGILSVPSTSKIVNNHFNKKREHIFNESICGQFIGTYSDNRFGLSFVVFILNIYICIYVLSCFSEQTRYLKDIILDLLFFDNLLTE